MDRIELRGVRARGYHRVHAEERRDGQDFVVDVVLELPLDGAARTDELAATVHYGHLARAVAEAIEGRPVDLIETVAERVADLALGFSRVRRATVTVHKPQAPIAVPFGDVAVTVERSRPASAVIALGANLGDRGAALARALEVLDRLPAVAVTDRSPVLETVALTPAGRDPERPAYLNQVARVTTSLPPEELLATLHSVEHAFGRERHGVWQDRTLDLDLIAYEDLVLETPTLVLPHPRAHERDFVLRPWLAMDPDAAIPGRGPVADLVAGLAAAA